jgi:hypothetical protein
MLEASRVCTQVVTSLAAGFFGCKSASVLALALPVSGHSGTVGKDDGSLPIYNLSTRTFQQETVP